jgi:Trm5-related predicted tRNA methylase
MEINDQVINDLANILTANKLNEAMLKSQNMMEQVKRIIKEVAEKNPEATRDEVLALAKNELNQQVNELQEPTVNNHEEPEDKIDDMDDRD